MKYLTFLLVALAVSCATFEKSAYVTIGTTTTAVELARQMYINYANICACVTTSEFAKVDAAYGQYQQAMNLVQAYLIAYKQSTVPNESALRIALDASCDSASNIIALVASELPKREATRMKHQLRNTR